MRPCGASAWMIDFQRFVERQYSSGSSSSERELGTGVLQRRPRHPVGGAGASQNPKFSRRWLMASCGCRWQRNGAWPWMTPCASGSQNAPASRMGTNAQGFPPHASRATRFFVHALIHEHISQQRGGQQGIAAEFRVERVAFRRPVIEPAHGDVVGMRTRFEAHSSSRIERSKKGMTAIVRFAFDRSRARRATLPGASDAELRIKSCRWVACPWRSAHCMIGPEPVRGFAKEQVCSLDIWSSEE